MNFRNKTAFKALSLTLVLGALFLFIDKKEFAFSYMSGSLTGILNFLLLSRSIASMAENKEQKKMFAGAGFRFGLMALLIVFFFSKQWFNLPAFFCGLFTIQGIIFFKVFFPKII